MSKYLACLPALLLLGFVMYKPVKKATGSELVNKNISFAMYKSIPYSSKAYNNSTAQVHIKVVKVNTSGQYTIIWDKVLDARSLSQYPTVDSALEQNVTIRDVDQKKEHLVADYTLIYNSEGSELQMHDATIVNDNSGKINICI